MTRYLLALLALLPLPCYAQFGGYSSDLPFMGVDAASAGDNLLADWDANILALSDGNSVTNWADSGSGGFTMVSSGANAPYWTNSSTVISNKGFVVFDGTNDFMVNSNIAASSQLLTFYMVCKPFLHRIGSTSTNTFYNYWGGLNSSCDFFQTQKGDDTTGWLTFNAGTNVPMMDAYGVYPEWMCLSVTFSNTYASARYTRNASTYEHTASTNGIGTNGIAGLVIGNSGVFGNASRLQLARFVVYSKVHTESERQTKESELVAEYNLNANVLPIPATNSLLMWVVADQKATNSAGSLAASNDFVAAWGDLSGVGHTLVQTVSDNNRPKYMTRQQNQKGVIRWHDSTYDRTLRGPTNEYAQPITIIMAAKVNTGTTSPFLFNGVSVTTKFIAAWLQSGVVNFHAGSIKTAAGVLDEWRVWSFVANGSSSSAYINGQTIIGPTSIGSNSQLGIYFGALNGTSADRLLGDISEIGYWNSALSDADRTYYENLLKSRYGIP